MFGANSFGTAYFGEAFVGVFSRPSLILRVVGFLSVMWAGGVPSGELMAALPESELGVGAPSGDKETDTPVDGWEVGKPV